MTPGVTHSSGGVRGGPHEDYRWTCAQTAWARLSVDPCPAPGLAPVEIQGHDVVTY